MDGASKIRIHILHCGSILVSDKVPCGGEISLNNSVHEVVDNGKRRVELPCSAYLIEHPQGLLLVDTGWSRKISPCGVYDAKAVRGCMPAYLASFFHPWVEKGKTAVEQLAAMGIKPGDIDTVLVTHLDADHVNGLSDFSGAKRILIAEEEQWWSCRTVYKLRQPKEPWSSMKYDTFWYKGTKVGPLWWSYDLFGDESVTLVSLPGHTDGMFAVKLSSGGRFVILAADAAFSERSWRELIIPGFGFNKKSMLKSLQWLQEQSREPGCAGIIANHDPNERPRVIEI